MESPNTTLPMILPEEFLMGYIGTVRQFLNVKSNRAAIRKLHGRFNAVENRQRSVIELIARACERSLSEIVAGHTLTPLSRAFAAENSDVSYGEDLNQNRLRVHASRFSAPYPQCCPTCINKDIDELGISYWRRHHLIRGIDHCIKHSGVQLISIRTDKPFTNGPAYYLAALSTRGMQTLPSCNMANNEFVRRYAGICEGLLNTKSPIGKGGGTAAIRIQANKLGLNLSASLNSSELHDLIQSHAPKNWLLNHFPKFSAARQSRDLEKSCLPNQMPIAAESIVLASTALYASSEDALKDFAKFAGKDASLNGAQRRIKSWSSPDVLRVYVEAGFDASAVAAHFGTADRATCRAMAERGYPSIQKALSNKAGEALKMFLTGSSFEDAVSHAEQRRDEFEKLLRSAAAPLAALFRQIDEGERR